MLNIAICFKAERMSVYPFQNMCVYKWVCVCMHVHMHSWERDKDRDRNAHQTQITWSMQLDSMIIYHVMTVCLGIHHNSKSKKVSVFQKSFSPVYLFAVQSFYVLSFHKTIEYSFND